VARILDRIGPPDGQPVVFLGDLNEWRPESPRLKHLRTRLPQFGAPRSFHARFPTLRLDRIFLGGPRAFRHVEAVRTKLTRHASDHLPVRALVVRTGEG
jgi:endonuclease/exonuclease/phosphatase family metal-dependent hydrolase